MSRIDVQQAPSGMEQPATKDDVEHAGAQGSDEVLRGGDDQKYDIPAVASRAVVT